MNNESAIIFILIATTFICGALFGAAVRPERDKTVKCIEGLVYIDRGTFMAITEKRCISK